jgi:hypothetical protein
MLPNSQSCGSGYVRYLCFWASWIRIRIILSSSKKSKKTLIPTKTITTWHKGEKYRQTGKEYHLFSPSWIFVLYFSITMKTIFRGKSMIVSFFPKLPIIYETMLLFGHFFTFLLFIFSFFLSFFCQHL